MGELARQIIVYSAAEQLAKEADFKGSSIDPYLERAERYYNDEYEMFSARERQTMRIQELQLDNDESTILAENPDLYEAYAKSNRHQFDAAFDPRNLDYYLDRGVEYEFDASRLSQLKLELAMDEPISTQLMRERIVGIAGLNPVRLNVVYHDMMDHLWGIRTLQEAGLDARYADFMAEVGNPFTGFLFSKQAELLSGIGYNTRRYVTDSNQYGSLGATLPAIRTHLELESNWDTRVDEVINKINNSKDLAIAAGFVISGALGSLLLQRSRDGAVKKMVETDKGAELTDTPVSLLDPRYIALIIDGVESLAADGRSYKQMQLDLNLTVESMLRDCIENDFSTVHLALGASRDISNIPKRVRELLIRNAGVSTSYYS